MRSFKLALGSMVLAAASLGGCASITGDSTLQDVLNASGLAGATVNDVLAAIENFSGHAVALPLGQSLTADQESQIADLQAQLAAGTITNQSYAEQLADLLNLETLGRGFGAGPGRHFGPGGFRGGPHGPGGLGFGGIAAGLDLTEDQQTQAQSIFDTMRTDVIALQDAARAEIEALLTADQLDKLNGFDSGYGQPHGLRLFDHRFDASRLAEFLALSEEQQASAQAILDTLEANVDARRTQARDEFRAILTADQQAIFDAHVAEHDALEAAK